MKAAEIREKFLQFWESKGHKRVESSSIVPVDDPTLLFTNAGMNQFKDVFCGNIKRDYTRATSSQRCVRAGGKHNDLEEVGHTARHHTFFEMLGNFSFGDYFKRDAIQWAWEFITEVMGIDKSRLYVSVYKDDDEAEEIWKSIGVEPERIYRFGDKDNFWMMGDTGPCGPCSEIFYDLGEEAGTGPEDVMGGEGDRFMEIWNLVFMQFEAKADGTRIPLPKPSVDTGMGLERMACVLQNKVTNYETDLFVPLTEEVKRRAAGSSVSAKELRLASQVIADHVRASVMLIADGVLPSNLGRGYVLRRIMRRAIRHSYQLGFEKPFLFELASIVISMMKDAHNVFDGKEEFICNSIKLEEQNFLRTIKKGLELLGEEISKVKASGSSEVSSEMVFKLYDTFGFPKDLTALILKEEGLKFSEEGFETLMEQQRERARSAQKFNQEKWDYTILSQGNGDVFCGYDKEEITTEVLKYAQSPQGDKVKLVLKETPFYAESGGQIADKGTITAQGMLLDVFDVQKEDGDIVHYCDITEGNLNLESGVKASVCKKHRFYIRRNHTAVHLLQGVLRERLGEHVQQAGSYVDTERFRFDFTHNQAIGAEEIKEIEAELYQRIHCGSPVLVHEKELEEARKMGAICPFGEKYGETVRVIEIPGYSMEFCGGIHAHDIQELGMVKIISEGSISAGVRRIEGTTSKTAFEMLQKQDMEASAVQGILKQKEEIGTRVQSLMEQIKQQEKELKKLKSELSKKEVEHLFTDVPTVNELPYVVASFEDLDGKTFRTMSDQLVQKLNSGALVLFNADGEKVSLICRFTDDWVKKGMDANKLLRPLAEMVGGKGGGRPNMAQAGGTDPSRIPQAREKVADFLKDLF